MAPFPLEFAPKWMRVLAYGFPLRYLNGGMLNVMGRGQGPMSALPQIGVLLGVALVAALLAARRSNGTTAEQLIRRNSFGVSAGRRRIAGLTQQSFQT